MARKGLGTRGLRRRLAEVEVVSMVMVTAVVVVAGVTVTGSGGRQVSPAPVPAQPKEMVPA